MSINETVQKYLPEMKSLSSLSVPVQKGIKSWVDDYKAMREYGNVKGAKQAKTNIDKEIKKYGLNPKEVYGDR